MPPVSSYRWENSRRSSFTIERWSWGLRLWMVAAIGLALLFHFWMFVVMRNIGLSAPIDSGIVRERPRMERIAINPDLMKEKRALQTIPDKIADQPQDKPQIDITDLVNTLPKDVAMDLTTQVSKITSFAAPSTKDDTPAKAPSMAALADSLPNPDLTASASVAKNTPLSHAVSPKQLLLPQKALERDLAGLDTTMDRVHQRTAGNGSSRTMPGYSNLDELLTHSSPITAGTKFALPTDLLFDYGSDQLADSARLSLMKLGYLINKNPNSRFIIEGYTDTFGTEGFNVELSQRRANAVVAYLVNSLHLTTERIEAVGMGKANLIVPAGSMEQQGPNRRVEIKVRPLR